MEDFPGLGAYEDYWTVGVLEHPDEPRPRQLSPTLLVVYTEIRAGLTAFDARALDDAAAIWGIGFEHSWGFLAGELVHALHPRAAAYRRDARADTRPAPTVAPVMLGGDAPTDDPGPDPSVGLGVSFEAVSGGLVIADVHPRGHAAGRLFPGDLVLTINGRAIDDLEPSDIQSLPIRFEVFREDGTVSIRLP